MCYVYTIIDHISTISGNILNANQNSLSSLSISYIAYFYHLFPLHPNTFHSLFHTHTLPGIKRLKLHIYCFTSNVSGISSTQIDSFSKFQSTISEFQSDIDCDIQELNSNIEYLSKFNSFVTKCVKSYLCNYITCIRNNYCSCHNSLKENIETLECIKKCVKSMLSDLSGMSGTGNGSGRGKKTSGPERYVKSVFSHISDDNVRSTISNIKRNLPLGRIRSIYVYLTMIDKFLHESNQIDKTTGELGSVKNYLSQFSGHIRNYTMRMPLFLINPLYQLIKSESTIKLIGSSGNGKNANGISKKYQEIKHKVAYCKASLEFEVKRLESISKNAKILEEHLGKISGILNNYKKVEDKLKELKRKIETLKNNKEKSMNYLKWVVRSIIFNFDKVKCISNSLKCRRYFVRITTIKGDIQNINSPIKDINNILSVVQSHLEYLFGVKLGVDCKILNEIESCILRIVCKIHNKYCCLSSDISEIFSEEPNSRNLGESCKLCEIVKCASATPTTTLSCGRCQGSQSSQVCQCCQKTCEGLQQLSTGSCLSNIEQKLKCIKKVICKLIDGKTVDGCNSGSENQQCSNVCQKGQTNTGTECKGTNIRELVRCAMDEINKFQTSLVKCEGHEDVKCEQITGKGTTTNCSASTGSTSVNCNQFDKVKLCIDTMINKCNCWNLKELINGKNIKLCVDVFKWVMITNFRELFSLYLCFDKSLLDQISCNINKLADIKSFISNKSIIEYIIKYKIDCIKNEINGLSTKVESLENTMKSGIREMECAIEGVARNFIRCSNKQLSTNLTIINTANKNRLIKDIGDAEVDNPVMNMYSMMSVMDYGVVVNRLYDSAKKIDQILQLVPLDQGCRCVLRLESTTNNRIILPNIYLYNIMDNLTTKTMDEFLKFLGLGKITEISRLGISENHVCLCMVIKYLLYPQIINIIQVLELDLNMLSTISRKFQKYTETRGLNVDISRFLIIMVDILQWISNWIRNNYTYSIIVHPHKVDIKCFCCYYQDRNYYGVVSIILVLSSLMENMWSMDIESLRLSINCLSKLLYEIYMISSDNSSNNSYRFNIFKLSFVSALSSSTQSCKMLAKLRIIVDFFSLLKEVPYLESAIKPYINNISFCNIFHFENVLNQLKQYNNTTSNGPKEYINWVLKKYESVNSDDKGCNKSNCCCNICVNLILLWVSIYIWLKVNIKLHESNQHYKERLEILLKRICNCGDDCCCKELKDGCKDLCCGTGCASECVCNQLKSSCEQLTKICCQDSGNGLCKLIKECLENICNKKGMCDCRNKEGCCRCVCCKLVGMSIKILSRACRANVLEPYKRVVLELLSCDKNKGELIKSILDSINGTTLNNIYLVKNNLLTSTSYQYSIGSHTPTINTVTNVETRNWGYDTKYEHDVTNDRGFIKGNQYPYVSNNTASYGSSGSNRMFKMIFSRLMISIIIIRV